MADRNYTKVTLVYKTDSAFKPHYTTSVYVASRLEWEQLVEAWQKGLPQWVGEVTCVRDLPRVITLERAR